MAETRQLHQGLHSPETVIGTFTAHNVRLDDGTETFPSAGWTIDQSSVLHSVKRVLELIWPQGLQTHVASATATEAIRIHGLTDLSENEGLPGRWYPEHGELPPDELERMKWHSWENTRSFWLQKEYLIQLVRDIGFDIVFEQFDFMADIAGEMTSGFYHTNDRILLVGIKSSARPSSSG